MISLSPMTERPIETREAGVQGQFPRRWLICFTLLIAAAGVMLLVVGLLMPAYTDSEAAERIRLGLECESGIPNTDKDRQCDSQLWHRAMNSLRTGKWSLVDSGAGLLLSGLTMSVFLWWRGRQPRRLWLTPKSTLSILALAALCWLVQIPAYALHFITEMTRGYHPHWADTIAIPMIESESILLGLFLPYMAIWLVFVVGARLPVSLFATAPARPLVNAFWTVATALLLVPIVLVLVGAVLGGPTLMVPFLWLTLWLALCARAAALTRHRRAQ
jgi:hypothetical protein